MDRKSSKIGSKLGTIDLTVSSAFSMDSSVCVIPLIVSKSAKEIYKQYISRYAGPTQPSAKSLNQYKNYINFSI